MAGILNAELAFPQFPALDQYGPNTTLLLHGDGTNGAQNNTFLDSSANNFTITRNGNATQGTFSPFSQPNGYWSNYFNQSGYLYNTSTSIGSFSTNNFTVECWFYITGGDGSYRFIYDTRATGSNSGTCMLLDNSNNLTFYCNGTLYLTNSQPPKNQWIHVAVCRVGIGSNQLTMYINGSSVATNTLSTNISSSYCVVGAGGDAPLGVGPWLGYISNFRMVSGTAVYTSNFTPPTTPLTAITNTVVLTCQSNRFVDNSASPVTFTVSGAPSVQSFHPISAPTAYYPAVNGGAGYFDGSGDYLATPTTSQPTASGDFTISCWFYLQSFAASYYAVGGNWTSGTSGEWLIQIQNNGTIRFLTTADGTFAGTVRLNEWTYFSASRSGTTVTVQLNGSTIRTYTLTGTLGVANETINIGQQVGNNWPWNGYIADFNFNTTTATTAVPTAPASVVSGTSLLLKFQNAGIIDSASQNQLETVGNAQVSTTQSKFGGASMYFDGTGDWLLLNNSPIPSTGDFTVELWFWSSTATTTFQGLFGFLGNSSGYAVTVGLGTTSATGASGVFLNVATGSSSWGINANSPTGITSNSAWYHLALVRSGGTITVYVNGNSVITSTAIASTTALGGGTINRVGALANDYPLNGYIDDFRVTRGIARYTQNFTPPQNAYPDYGPLTNIPTVDPNFKNTTLLLHGNGTNGAQNNTFLDSSTNNFTITRNGNTTQGTFTPFSQPNGWWSNYFNGSSYLYSAIDASLALGTSDFTIEAWVYFTTNTTTQTTICAGPGTTTYDMIFGYTYNGAPSIVLYLSSTGSSWDLASGVAMSPNNNIANSWNHIALTRSGSTFRTFFNGSQQATFTSSASVYQSANQFCIGSSQRSAGNANYMNGYISNAKVVIGTSLYNSNFTPSTLPLTATTNTKLITCQSNYFKDNSSNSLAIGASGTPSVQNFYPFFPPLDYSTAAIGGSGYYDGAGDFLNTPTSGQFTAAGDFTVSCWFYLQSFGNSYYVVGGNWSAGTSDEWLIQIQNNGAIRFLTSADGTFSSAGVVTLNQWMYFTATRSGTTVTVQVNGTTVRTYTKSDTLGSATKSINIGQQPGNNWPWNGYIADFRLVSGSAVTTIPTTPATAISGTGLLLSCTNGAIFDNASKNDLETVGNAQISTTQSKFGGSSMYFDGSGDYLIAPDNQIYSFGTGDFTVECWIYINTLGRLNGIWANGPASTGSFGFYVVATNKLEAAIYGASALTGATSLAASTWYHVAVSRSGSTMRLFVNGNQDAISTSYSNNNTTSKCTVGEVWTGYGGSPDAYIDDLRITKGVSRYNYNFTPPAAQFPNK